MSKITLLAPHEARKIAAGEVVERPVNVVKELVENALDAQAKQVTVFIEEAGKKLIRVVDDGCGMDQVDAQRCFAHHATSKLTTVADLERLLTFGFRGEALSSIAAVSKVTLLTAEHTATAGTQVFIQDGSVIEVAEHACSPGTDIAIRDLFYNVPARQKFLKKNETEWRQIQQLFQAFVFAYQKVHFRLYHDGKLLYNCPPVQKLQERVAQLWEQNIAHNSIALVENAVQRDIGITGVVTNHQTFRYNRNNIFIFVNNRLVKNHVLVRALTNGYTNVLPPGRYPAAVLFVSVLPHEIDVNIHPRKEEIRFLHERHVIGSLTLVVKQSLEHNLSQQLGKTVAFREAPFQGARATSFDFDPVPEFSRRQQETATHATIEQLFTEKRGEQQRAISPIAQTAMVAPSRPEQQAVTEGEVAFRFLGVLHKTYLLVERAEGLVLVDQHAAHERVLYELFAQRFAKAATVKLLFPLAMTLSPQELQLLIPYLGLFTEQGVEIEPFGEDQLVISATPTYVKSVNFSELIRQLLGWITAAKQEEPTELAQQLTHKLRAQMACKAAVKAGDVLPQQQIVQLLADLEKSDNRLTCPHGRPTFWKVGLDEIEKKFKRRL